MAIMVLVRGLPGSGKSTYAKVNFASQGFKHLETDMFFNKNGVIKYEPGKYAQAVEWCQRRTIEAVKEGLDLVISNHFLCHWELGFYLQLAEKNNYEVIVHTCLTQYAPKASYPQRLIDIMKTMFEE